jgi:hypothetical protein
MCFIKAFQEAFKRYWILHHPINLGLVFGSIPKFETSFFEDYTIYIKNLHTDQTAKLISSKLLEPKIIGKQVSLV